MSYKPFKPITNDSLMVGLETRKQLDRLNSFDRTNLLNNPRFNWIQDDRISLPGPFSSPRPLGPLGGLADLRNEVNSITSGPSYLPNLPPFKK